MAIVKFNQDNLITLEEDLQIETSESFINSLQLRLIPSKYLSDLLMATFGMFEFNSRALDDAWIKVYDILLHQLPQDILIHKVVPFIINLGDYSQVINSRITAAVCITHIAKVLKSSFRDSLLNITIALAQDANSEVRKALCENLEIVCKAVPIQVVLSQILPEIIKLVKDEDKSVKSAGIKVFTDILEDLPLEFVKENCLNVVCDDILNATDVESRISLTYSIGKLLQVIVKVAPGTLTNKVLSVYNEMSLVEQPEIRQNVAFNLPGVVKISGIMTEEIKQIITRFTEDEDLDVRKKLAVGFHEIIRLQPNSGHFLWLQLEKLLDSCDTLQCISPHLKEILSLLPSERSFYSSKLSKLLSKDLSWRCTYELLEVISNCLDLLDKNLLDLLPSILINIMKLSCQPLKLKSAELYADMIRFIHIREKKNQLCEYIKEHIPVYQSCFTRQIFIDFCIYIQKHHSKSFFETHFADSLYQLVYDSVTSVRIKLASNLPKLREGIPDSHASTVFYRAMNTLINDPLDCVNETAADSQIIMMSKEYISLLNSEQLRRNDNLKREMEEQQERRAEEEHEEARKRIFIEWEAKARKEAYSTKKKTGKVRTPQLIMTRKVSSDIKKVSDKPNGEKKQMKAHKLSPVKITKSVVKRK